MNEKQRNIIIKFLIWCLGFFAIIFIGVNNIFADEIQNIGYITNYTDLTLINTSFGMTYDLPDTEASNQNFTIQQIDIYIDYSFGVNKTYLIEMSTPLATLQNIDRVSILSGSTRCSYLGIENDNINFPNIKFTCPNSVNNLTISLYNSSGNAITSNNTFRWNYTYLREIVPTVDIGPIINNQTQNTQEIINNNNTNTNNIINNQNANTDKEIESQQVCNTKNITYADKIQTGSLSSNGGIISSNTNWGVTDYILLNNATINISGITNYQVFLCFYNENKQLNSCINYVNITNSNITIPDNAKYVRFSLRENNQPIISVYTCQNGNQALNDSIEEQTKTSKGILGKIGDLFDNLFSNDDADISGLDNMVGWLPPGPVDSIINLPLSLFNSLTNTLSGTCTPVTLTLPFVNQNLTLPCFDAYMSQYVSGFNTLWTWVGVTVSVFILYRYLLNLYKWIDDTLTMRENNLPGYYDDNMWGGA